MKTRTDPEARRLPDGQRARLRALLDAIPEGAPPEHPSVQRLLEFGLTLTVPWWAPGAACDYALRLGAVDRFLSELGRLAACEDWGSAPPGEVP